MEMPTLEQLVKIIYGVIITLILLFVISGFYRACVAEDKDQKDFDFERIIAEIQALDNGESIGVPIKGEFYNIVTFEKGTSASDSHCRDKTCICLYKGTEYSLDDKPSSCERFSKGGKLVGGSCTDGDICFTVKTTLIETQAKVSVVDLEKNNNIVTISPRYEK